MLPWMDKKNVITSVISARKGKVPVEVKAEQEMGEGIDADLKVAAEDFLSAVQQKSVVDLAKAFKAAFQILESMPHEENEEMEEMSDEE